jgi:protein-disulfide isomerase-like protein with CxxC motif
MRVTLSHVRIRLNLSGFRRLRTSPAARAMVMARAERIARAAGPGFVTRESPGRNRARAVVFPDTPAAAARNRRDLVLLRSISAGR